MKTGDYYDLVADLSGLPRPARVTRAQAGEHFSAAQWSFLNESRRLVQRAHEARAAAEADAADDPRRARGLTRQCTRRMCDGGFLRLNDGGRQRQYRIIR